MHDSLSELAELSLQLKKRNISLWNANTCIERTIRVIDSMPNQLGPNAEEASHACEYLKFKDVPLINNVKIPKINSGQFFRGLANNIRTRLFTF